MQSTLHVGIEGRSTAVITGAMTTGHAGPAVLSTPSMILLMEGVCATGLAPYLAEGETTVGVHVDVSHQARADIGEEVTLQSRLAEVEGRFLTWEVSAWVGDRLLGRGTHKRALVRARPGASAPVGPTAPPVEGLPVVTEDVAQAKIDLDRWGYCLFGGALSGDELASVRRRLVEQAAGEADAGVAVFDNGAGVSRQHAAGSNQRLRNLINKGAEFQAMALRGGVPEVLEHVLGERFLLTSYSANITAPGCEQQVLHQDQGYVTRPYPLYPIVTNVVWALDDVDANNGGTRVVPGSHLWTQPLQDEPSLVVSVEAPAGTAVLVDGRTYHGAGKNRSTARRHVLLVNYCRAWVRQQDNPFLGLSPDVEAALSPELRRLLGFKTWGTLGGVGDPNAVDAAGFVHRTEKLVARLP